MDDPRRILVIQLKRAGDILVTTPVLPALKKRFPEARLDFLCHKAFVSLLENHPSLDTVESYDRTRVMATIRRIRSRRYDWILDFQSSPRSALLCLASGASLTTGYRVPFWGQTYKHAVKRPSGSQPVVEGKFSLIESLTGPLGPRPARQLVLNDAERAWAATNMPSGKSRPIGIVATHRRDSRRWPAGYFVTLIEHLSREGQDVWLFWGPGEKDYVEAIQRQVPSARLIPDSTLRQMAALFERCRLVITNDNGPMHVAVSVGTPTLTVYGPTDPLCWNPGGQEHQVIQALDVPCLGCNLNDCPFSHECMTHVSPEVMLARARQMMLSSAPAVPS